MTLSLSVVQRLLVLTAFFWAVFPTWGGFAFGATWLLMAFGTYSRTRKARRLLESNLDRLKALSPEGVAFTRRFPLAFVWPSSAEQWGTTWQMTSLLSLLLAGAFVLRALLTWDPTLLFLLVPLAVQLVAGGGMGRRLKVSERVKEDLSAMRVTHDATVTLLLLKTAVGQWPPEPSPDPEPAPP